MKTNGSPRTARKFSQRTRIITAITTFSLLLLMLGVPAFMQSLQKGDTPDTTAIERGNLKDMKAPPKSKADLEAAGYSVEQDIVAEPSVISATTNYTFSNATNGTLTDMTGSVSPALVLADQDDTASAVTNIGFDFYFQGVRYAQFSVNSNGLMRLGSTVVQGSSPYKPLAQASIPLITPYGADQRTLASTGKVHYKVIGTAPNRTLVVEWLNMQSNFNSGGTSDLTYQARLYETTGVIEYVYGKATMSVAGAADVNSKDPHIGFSSSNAVGTVGSVTAAQSGTPAPTYNGGSATPVANTYTAGAIPVLNTTTEGSRRIFTFTPPTPDAAPGGPLTFSATSSSVTVNWTDSATNESGYGVYYAPAGNTNFTFGGQTAANATSLQVTGLSPSTNYDFRVVTFTEGAVSSATTGTQATAAPANITSTPVGGNWSATTTWVGGVLPTINDNVTIADGATVTIDTAANALNLNVATGLVAPTILQYEATTARTLTVASNVTIASNGTFQSAATGTQTGHVLSVGGNLTNNGVLDFSTTATNVAGAGITFTGAANNTFGGTGATTDVRTITINKGTSNANILELSTSAFTVRGATTDSTNALYLTLTNGTFKISGTFTANFRTLTSGSYTIGATTGLWLNNPNYTATGQNGSLTLNGLLRISQGTYNVGTASGNEVINGAGAVFTIEGGTFNVSGRFNPQNAITYTQTGGTMNICTVGNALSNFGSFELFSASATFTMSGGTINIIQASTGSTQIDYQNLAAANVTGGTLNIGTAATVTKFTFNIRGNTPSLVINNTTNNKSASATATTVINGNLTVNTGTTFTVNNVTTFLAGTTVTNNGAITSTGTSARFDFAGSAPMSYGGSGTFGTNATPFGGVGVSSNSASLITLNSPIVTTRVNLFQGGFVNSNQITLGNAGSSSTVVQIGSAGLLTPGGSFDVSPVHNQGTGGEIIIYQQESVSRTTGVEVNPTRTLNTLSVANTNGITIAGGDITVNGTAAGALTMTNAPVTTGANTLYFNTATGTVVQTLNGYVIGNFKKRFTAAGSKTFEVGTANGFSPVTVNATAGTFPADFTVKATQGKAPYVSGTNALARYWTLTGTGITANLTFTYLATDVTGTVANYQFIKNSSGTLSTLAPTGTPTSTSATINGVSSFSDWTLAEPGAVQRGSLQLSSATYSINEDGGSIIVPVTRTGGADGAVSVQYTTNNGTATAGSDYTTQTGTLNWAAGDAANKNITIPITDDSVYEGNEDFTVTVSAPGGGATLGTPSSATVTINENDTAPTFSIDDVTHMEGNSGTTSYVFTISKTGSTALNATVSYETVDGTATSPSDFTAIAATPLPFLPGDTSQQITVFVNGDTTAETDPETFTVHLSNASGATIADADGTGTIQNDDNANTNPTISDIADQSVSQDNSVTASFTVGDTETPAANLTLTGSSSDQTLVPDANITFGGTGANRTVTVTPAAGQNGMATITVTVHDANSGTASDSFVLTVNPVTCYAPPTGMVSWYSAENNADDIQGTNNGTANGATYAAGKVGQAFSVDGVDDYVSTANNVMSAPTELTMDAWVKPNVQSGDRKRILSIEGAYLMSVDQNGTVECIADGDENDNFAHSSKSIVDGVFHHVACTNDGATTRLYIDGVLDGTASETLFDINTLNRAIVIGNNRPGEFDFYNGLIDEVEIFNRALTSTEIAGIYNASSAGKCHTSTLQFSSATYNENENGNPLPITVTRTGAHDTAASVDYATTDGTATGGASCGAGVDYQTSSGTLSFAAGEVSKTFTVPVCDDAVFEGDETVNLALSNQTGTGVTLGTPNTGVLTINDDEGQPSLSVNDFTFTGADSRVVDGFTVTLSSASAQTITVHYATSDDTALAGQDYTATSGTLTFDPGDTTKTIPVTILADNVNEPTETFNVDLDTPTNATILDGHGVGTIPNDDAAPTLSIDDVMHDEGDSGTTSYTFTVTKTGATSQTVTVDFTTADGTATTANSDYQTNSGSLTFLPGDSMKTVTVLVGGDVNYEPDETFFVNLSNATNATISDGQGLGTITNDDAKPTLSITSAVTLTEGNSGTKNFNFTVTKSGATDLDATVSFATADGTATGGATCGAGVDYTSQSGTLTFHPADTTMTVTVVVCGDTVYETNETFFVNLSSPTDATITTAQGTGTINNDDKPPATLVVNTTDDLNSGFCLAAHCSLREAITAANSNSDSNTINFQIPAGDPGHFYYADDSTAGQLSLANVTATTASDDTTISGIDPDWPHSWWTISPQSALPSITTTVTINGYSQPTASANTAVAGDNAVLRVELNGAGAGVSVNGLAVGGSSSTVKGLVVNRFGGSGVSMSGGLHIVTGNFVGTDASGTLALANGAAGIISNGFSSQIGGVTPAERNLLSGNTGDGVSLTTGNSYIVQGNLVGTKADGTSALGNGANGVSLSGSALFNTVGGVDPGEANTIAFNGGDGVQLDTTASFSNSVRGNSIYSNGTTSAHLGIDLGTDGVTPNDAQDADTGPNNLQNFPVINSALVTGSTKTITGTLNSKPNQEFTIDFYSNPSCDTSGNGEGKTHIGSLLTDTTDANGDVSFTFHPSSLTSGQAITATATDSGGNTSEFSACTAVAGGNAGTIEFSMANYSVAENVPGGVAHITVRRVGGSDGSISATFNTSDGTATAGSDYTAVTGQTVTFNDGDTADQTVDVAITDNMVYEGNETVNLSLSSTTVNVIGGGANPLAAVLTIVENDAQPSLSIDDVTFTVADSRVGQSFTVTLVGATDLPVTVHYATSDGTAHAGEDYTSASGTLTFNPGVTTQPIPISIVADNRNEPTEDFFVDLDMPTNATISDGHGVGTIPNDDAEPTLSVDDFTFTGADSRTVNGFTVNLSAPSSFTVTVHYATSDDTAHAGEDYTAATGTLTFDPGDTTKVIPVTILGDSTNEPEETFNLDLDTPTHATISDGHAVGTIPNDDPTPSMSIANATKVEGDSGTPNVTFTVTLSNPSSQTVSAQFTTTNGTASSGSDYSATTGTVTFDPNQTTKSITVPVAGDIKDEANETFSVVLSNPLNASISAGTGVCTIIDDDLNSGDFDGDGKNDLAVFRPSADNTFNSKWYILNSADGSVVETQFGTETDIPVAADYDGDGKKEIAVFRPSEGAWYISRGSASNFVHIVWGLDGDKPVPGDYDGDGKVDVAVFRPSDGYWYIRRSTDDQLQAQPWGLSTDKPVPADYDGDGKTDLAVFRKDDPVVGSGTWYILNTSNGSFSVAQWGFNTDKLVPADYDLDGKADIAVWRPTDGTFYVRRSSDGGLATAQWGLNGDVPIVGDYDGDGKADYAVFRPSSGHHFILKSSDGTYIGPIWGISTDIPVAARYVPEQ